MNVKQLSRLSAPLILVALCAAAWGGSSRDRDAARRVVPPAEHPVNRQTATFAAGCFWGVEAVFRQVTGVSNVTVGYTGGTVTNPTYEAVCSNTTGHAEAVLVEYDPSRVTYERLLEVFWNNHNPTTPNRQGPDWGSQYRSAIFYHSPEQQAAAEASKQRLERSHRFASPIVTDIVPAGPFYLAEEYHQRYLEKHGGAQCPINLGGEPSKP